MIHVIIILYLNIATNFYNHCLINLLEKINCCSRDLNASNLQTCRVPPIHMYVHIWKYDFKLGFKFSFINFLDCLIMYLYYASPNKVYYLSG